MRSLLGVLCSGEKGERALKGTGKEPLRSPVGLYSARRVTPPALELLPRAPRPWLPRIPEEQVRAKRRAALRPHSAPAEGLQVIHGPAEISSSPAAPRPWAPGSKPGSAGLGLCSQIQSRLSPRCCSPPALRSPPHPRPGRPRLRARSHAAPKPGAGNWVLIFFFLFFFLYCYLKFKCLMFLN